MERTSGIVTALRRVAARLLFLPTLAWNLLLARVLHLRHWWDAIDQHVVMGALPFSRDVPRMQHEGIRAVVNTCEEYAGPTRAYAAAGIEQLRIPTIDFTPPQLADVQRAVSFIQRQVAQGHKVYVHCKAGRARSGTVVICYLISQGLTPTQAQQLILRQRPHANPHLARRSVVQQFWQQQQPAAAAQPPASPSDPQSR